MKCIPVIIFCSAALYAADFVNGQAARAVIGQVTFTAADPNSSNTVLGAANGIAYAANTLFVADSNIMGAAPVNNRVLMFQNLSSQLPQVTAELPYLTTCPVCVGTATLVLGQPDFITDTINTDATQNNLRLPSALASDGVHLAVADTYHNRVLIWNHLPTYSNAPADVVVGQANFANWQSLPLTTPPTASSMRAPQGVWIQNGKLFVADTQNNRVLIWNSIPTANGVPADVVLGFPNFTTYSATAVANQSTSATASNMQDPVSVTSDGTHVFVADLGYNRVLIWNSIPTSNGVPADVEIGQPDMVSSIPDNAYSGSPATTAGSTDVEVPVLCPVSSGKDANNAPTYPGSCNATLSFPRFALSDGTRLYIADGGNDRVLEFEHVPTQNAVSADIILGEQGGTIDQASNAADSMNTPTSLAWDGSNLYVADPYNRRIAVYTPLPVNLPYQAVVNAANLVITASGTITVAGSIHEGDTLTVTTSCDGQGCLSTNTETYNYEVAATDALSDVINNMVTVINSQNGGDPNVVANADTGDSDIVLTAKVPGPNGNSISFSVSTSTGALLTTNISGDGKLTGGGGAANVGPGSLVSICVTTCATLGTNPAPPFTFGSNTVSADLTKPVLPTQMGGVEVYFNGIRVPLLYVSPTQINAQVPWEVGNTTSLSAYVRSVMSDGSIQVTSPVAVSIVPANPGIFSQNPDANGYSNPRIAWAYHEFSQAHGVVSVDGTPGAGDTETITIGSRTYNYTTVPGDTLDSIRDNLVALINTDPQVTAYASTDFDRIVLLARVAGPDGDGIVYGASTSSGATETMTVLGGSPSVLCCANIAGALVTPDNPASANEIIYVYATGLGLPVVSPLNQGLITTGSIYPYGAPPTVPPDLPCCFVSAIAGGSSADVLSSVLIPGSVANFLVELHLSPAIGTKWDTVLTIAQGVYVSYPTTIQVQGTVGQ
ncbi:MAG: hypothetical protein ABSH42_03550 [Bryobacteraceae bacterium]|jgi:uncharacterized protein (TIGR03437 family)